MDLAPISFQKHHDRATIEPRLGVDRGPRFPSIVVRSSRSDSAAKDVRSRHDRGSIAARSNRDRGVLPRLVCTVRWRSSSEVDGHDRTSLWLSDHNRKEGPPPAVHLVQIAMMIVGKEPEHPSRDALFVF